MLCIHTAKWSHNVKPVSTPEDSRALLSQLNLYLSSWRNARASFSVLFYCADFAQVLQIFFFDFSLHERSKIFFSNSAENVTKLLFSRRINKKKFANIFALANLLYSNELNELFSENVCLRHQTWLCIITKKKRVKSEEASVDLTFESSKRCHRGNIHNALCLESSSLLRSQ